MIEPGNGMGLGTGGCVWGIKGAVSKGENEIV
jgi:hypothetical protein